MPNTVIVATATKQQNSNTSNIDNTQAAFVQKMIAKIQKQMFEMTRSNLGM